MMSVSIEPGPNLVHTAPHAMFQTTGPRDFDVTADGQRFLIAVPDVPKTSQVNVILNWTTLLKR